MTTNHSRGPLDGIRVLDFTNMMSGPTSTRFLADMGAEVIKIEPPTGDHTRSRHPLRDGYSVHFGHLNAGKKSVALNLKTAAGRTAALELSKHADVVVENWRPGVAARLGLDYATVSKAKPDIVYCSISGFGQQGPLAQRTSFASIVEAASGYALAQKELDGVDRPQVSGMYVGDSLTGLWAFAAIQTALVQRERTGRGQLIDVAMLDSMLFLLLYECHMAQFGPSIRRAHVPLRTADGFMVVAPAGERNFHDLARAVGHPEWIEDPRFKSVEGRNVNWFELLRVTEEWTSKRSTAECERILQASHVPCSRYNSFAEIMQEPHLAQRGSFAKVKDGAGEYLVTNVAFQMPGSATHARSRVPDFNADAVEVLKNILGYSPEQIKACAVEYDPH